MLSVLTQKEKSLNIKSKEGLHKVKNTVSKLNADWILWGKIGKSRVEDDATSATNSFDEVTLHMRQLLKSKLVELDLSVRALNCLKTAEVETLGELVSFHKNDLLKFRNFGKKSLVELEELVSSKNLSFGMDITRYNLDKE